MTTKQRKPTRSEDQSFDDAVDWLINSRYVDPGALDVFWRICEGEITRDQASDILP